MCIIYPPLTLPLETVLVIKNDGEYIILYYKNQMYTDHFLMNFMIYADKIINVSNVHKFEPHIYEMISTINSNMGHKCTRLNFGAGGCFRTYENEEMLCHVNYYDDYISKYKNIIEDLSLKFPKTQSLFNKIRKDDYKEFYQNSIEVMIKEFKRLEKEEIPLFNKKNLYIVTSIMNNTDPKRIEQILELKFKPDLRSNVLLIPTLHEKDVKEEYKYNFTFLGSLNHPYEFKDMHNILNLKDEVLFKNNSYDGISIFETCSTCLQDNIIMHIDNDCRHYNVCASIKTNKNNNFLTYIQKI